MQVIAHFVDKKNRKRYAPGDTIDPPLDAEQVKNLKRAGCIVEDGAATGAARLGDTIDLSTKSKAELVALAAERNVDITDCSSKADIVAKLTGA